MGHHRWVSSIRAMAIGQICIMIPESVPRFADRQPSAVAEEQETPVALGLSAIIAINSCLKW
jgi:hypothetical protein